MRTGMNLALINFLLPLLSTFFFWIPEGTIWTVNWLELHVLELKVLKKLSLKTTLPSSPRLLTDKDWILIADNLQSKSYKTFQKKKLNFLEFDGNNWEVSLPLTLMTSLRIYKERRVWDSDLGIRIREKDSGPPTHTGHLDHEFTVRVSFPACTSG